MFIYFNTGYVSLLLFFHRLENVTDLNLSFNHIIVCLIAACDIYMCICVLDTQQSLQELPPTLGCLDKLNCLNLDENLLEALPEEVSGQDSGLCLCVCLNFQHT